MQETTQATPQEKLQETTTRSLRRRHPGQYIGQTIAWAITLGLLLAAGSLVAQGKPPEQRANESAARSVVETLRIEALLDKEDYSAALKRIEDASLDPAISTLLLAHAYNGLGDWENGVKLSKQATKLLPNSVPAHLAYATALGMKMSNVGRLSAMRSLGTYKKSIATALTLEPDNVNARAEEIGFLFNAPGIAGGSVRKARRLIEELRYLDPKRALRLEISLEDNEQNADAALAASAKLLALDPQALDVSNGLAMRLQQATRYSEADTLFLRVAEKEDSPWSLAALYQLGRSRVLGNYELEKAVEYFDDYVKRHPSFDEVAQQKAGLPSVAAAHWRKGLALQQQGLKAQARKAYQAALTLDPDFKEAKASLRSL